MDMLRQVKPTMFYGVSWVWDRLLDDLKTSQLALTPFQRKTDQCAMGLGLRVNKRRLSRGGWGAGAHRGARLGREGSPERWQVDLRVARLAPRRQWGWGPSPPRVEASDT